MKILITGGAGYIGSTVGSACEEAGHEVVVLDDLSAGRREFVRDRTFYEGDIADQDLLDRVFSENQIDAVVHCAAKIIVPESVDEPLTYYGNNVGKTVALLKGMERNGVHRILFSSSASIYATDEEFKVTEESALDPGSPYATTKFMVEFILRDAAHASDLKALSLRYFNPIGSDPKLRTGQQIEHPTHVLGKMIDAWMEGSTFTVTGVDWPTRDGSGIRDYIHVWDLAALMLLLWSISMRLRPTTRTRYSISVPEAALPLRSSLRPSKRVRVNPSMSSTARRVPAMSQVPTRCPAGPKTCSVGARS